MSCPFQSDLVLDQCIGEARLRAYNAGFDKNAFRLQPLVDVIAEVIPEFAHGPHDGSYVPMTELRRRLKEAATRIYTTENYQGRGEFGELILHLLLRDYFSSIPLISKIHFKDADNATVHGFDGVHVVVTPNEKQLWLGESKLYKDGAAGVKDLATDVGNHLQQDYLRREFSLISPKLPTNDPDVQHWRRLMHEHRRLEDVLDSIAIPVVCTYSSKVFKDHDDNTRAYLSSFIEECHVLNKMFLKKQIRTDVNVILLLLPVPDKDTLVSELHQRLKHMQSI